MSIASMSITTAWAVIAIALFALFAIWMCLDHEANEDSINNEYYRDSEHW